MIAAEHQRKGALAHGRLDLHGKKFARLGDDRQILRARLFGRRFFGDAHRHVAAIARGNAERFDRGVQAGIANRGGPHVDAAPVGAQIHRHADHVDAQRAHGAFTGSSRRGFFVRAGGSSAGVAGCGSNCSRSTRSIAATGTAKNVPIKPNISLPIKIERMM